MTTSQIQLRAMPVGRTAARHLFMVLALAALAACGGGGSENEAAAVPDVSVPTPVPAVGETYYFSDCQPPDAAPGCRPGNNANPGTDPSVPKQTLEGFDHNSLPAGSRLLFARGGSWHHFAIQLQNGNATLDNPLVLDSYAPSWGGSARPSLRVSTRHGYAIQFGAYANMAVDGGYVIRNLKLDGNGLDDSLGIHLRYQTRGVVIEGNEITGFGIGVLMGNEGDVGQQGLVIRNNHIHHIRETGVMGDANDVLFEGNLFEYNFDGTSSLHGHAIYLGGRGRNATIRNNTFANNSVVGGTCISGNVTAHGTWDSILIENNTITQGSSNAGCRGVSISSGYADVAEALRGVVIRGNTIHNLTMAVFANAAPGIVIDANRITSDQAGGQVGIAVALEPHPGSGGDAVNGNAVVRNNVVCFSSPTAESTPFITSAATTVTGNVYRSGVTDASTGACAR